ncbi:hypothetical protein B0H14DRAFT_1527018 [Mycena olivaceomarginata]|nr:hypothetical protein B0H14DRAFT_1527018 [Mycena olivaceomarginata]
MSSTPVRIRLISCMTSHHSASAKRSDHPSPTFPHVEQHRSVPIEPDHARHPVPKPRSRRCFVCGTTGMHPLDFRVCPRTTILLRRSLAKINHDGRLVSFNGSPLPMTRHPGGVAAHIISRFRNPTRIVVEPPKFPPAPPYVAHVPPRPGSNDHIPVPRREFNSSSPHAVPPIELFAPAPTDDRILFPRREFNSSSPHAVPPIELIASAPEHVPLVPASFLGVLLACLLHGRFRAQLHTLLDILDDLDSEDHSTFRQRLHPVFSRIPHFTPVT